MNIEKNLSLIQNRFRDLKPVGTDVFRAERKSNGFTIGVFYFDFGQPLRKSTFKLNEYLQQVIATDFYQHEGSLQWNYYLYFILDDRLFSRLWKDGTAATIEADRVFARKFVKSEELFDKELTEPLAERVGTTHPPKDIATAWTKALTDGGLGKICDSKVPYTRVVEEFLSGFIVKSAYEFDTSSLKPAAAGRAIHKLQIKKFREHPLTKYYEFARVNLFRGPNGAGKTSLLEAIELSICGGILRQGGDKPARSHIDITFEGTGQPEHCPSSSAGLYRARDLAWYGQYYPTKNRLWQNFGRFNFFDSDAAFKLSQGKTHEDITSAIGTLFLGEQATTLEERMKKCGERFETEEGQLSRKLTALRKQNASWKSDLKELGRVVDTREALFDQVYSKAKDISWKKLPAKLNLKQLVGLRESADNLVSELSETMRQIDWLAPISLRSLNAESKKLTQGLTDIQALQLSADTLAKRISDTREELSQLESEAKTLDRLRAYHEADGFVLNGLSSAIEQARARMDQRKKATEVFARIDAEVFRKSKISFRDYHKERADQIRRQRTAISRKRATLEALETTVGQTRALVEQIKGLGHSYCELNPDSSDCPLCGAHYDSGLLEKIGPLRLRANVDPGLRELAADIAREENTLSEAEKILENLEVLGEAGSLVLSKKELESSSPASIVTKLSAITSERSGEQIKLEELTQTQSRLNRQGFSEPELRDLLGRGGKHLGLTDAALMKSSIVAKEADKRRKSIADLNKKLLEFDKDEKRNERQVRQIEEQSLGSLDFYDPVVELERRLAVLRDAQTESERVERSISIHLTDDFTQITRRLTTFSETLQRIQQALRQVEERDLLERRLRDGLKQNESEIASIEPRHQRATQALELINGLLTSENKEQYIADTVKEHHEKLSTLFCKIHAPNEFEAVELNGQLSLRRSTGERSSVLEISTGQRAALALSIFLAMNISVSNKAPWLLFDDPIAHVDDLNILSFFDTLRDLLLLGNQQIFFATASSRIADLFVRKFDFLGTEGLKQFPLDRPN